MRSTNEFGGSRRRPRVEPRRPAEFLPQRPFFFGESWGHLNVGDDIEVATFSAPALGQPMPAHAQLGSLIGGGRNANLDRALEGGGDDGRPQHGLPRREIDVVIQICAPHSKIRMRGIAHSQVKIACRRAAEVTTTRPAAAGTFVASPAGRYSSCGATFATTASSTCGTTVALDSRRKLFETLNTTTSIGTSASNVV